VTASAPKYCTIVRNCDVVEPPTGAAYFGAISAETLGTTSLWYGLIKVAPGHRTNAHTHPHETGLYVVKGAFDIFSGEKMDESFTAAERDFVLIPAGVPHVAINKSADSPVFAIVARSDPRHVEPAEMTPELDDLIP
jgi:uncharacterized RmlC-like cupin family protein